MPRKVLPDYEIAAKEKAKAYLFLEQQRRMLDKTTKKFDKEFGTNYTSLIFNADGSYKM